MTLARSTVLAAGLSVALGALWITTESPELWEFGLVVAVVIAAQLLGLNFRINSIVLTVAWGEAAVIVGLHLLPAGWLPLAVAIGSAIAGTARWLYFRRSFDPGYIVVSMAVLALAAAATAALGTAIADPYRATLSPSVTVALVAGAVAYLVVTTTGTGLLAAGGRWAEMSRTLRQLISRKLLMFLGNVTVGLTVVALADTDPRWLLALPPVLWLLHQTYGNRLRAIEDRRAWTAFAKATRSLNQLEERLVAEAAVRGALDVFSVGQVEVEVQSADGTRHRWVGGERGEVRMQPAGEATVAAEPGLRSVSLLVGGEEIGQLRVSFPGSAGPGHRDEMALQAFGDALAAALHDAATHQELRALLERAAHDAQHDTMTGLFNRTAMISRGETALQLVPDAAPVALLLLDVKHFREINDTLGHSVGDDVLRLAAHRLAATVRPGELLGRLGGDEFALLVTEAPAGPGESSRRAVRRAQELVAALAAPAEVSGVSLSIEAAVGVVVAQAGTADMIELMRRANVAMRHAKESSGAVAHYDGGHDAGSTDRLALLAELRGALAGEDELVLVLQPAVDLATGTPTGVEALVRWRHPRRGLLSPGEFVRIVENSDQLAAFTTYVIDRALAVAAQWADDGLAVPVSVNLSARSLLDTRLPGVVGRLLERHQVPPRRLVLEITETVMMSELAVIDEVLASLRALGVQLAVDDFGTGYSSLSFLTRIPVDEVKVDRTFVAQMTDSHEAAAIVRATVQLGRDLGLRVVAEGVETAAQRKALAKLGCTAGQGFHFAQPTPADQICEMLRSLASAAKARVVALPADGTARS